MVELLLRGGVKVGAELGEGGNLAVVVPATLLVALQQVVFTWARERDAGSLRRRVPHERL